MKMHDANLSWMRALIWVYPMLETTSGLERGFWESGDGVTVEYSLDLLDEVAGWRWMASTHSCMEARRPAASSTELAKRAASRCSPAPNYPANTLWVPVLFSRKRIMRRSPVCAAAVRTRGSGVVFERIPAAAWNSTPMIGRFLKGTSRCP